MWAQMAELALRKRGSDPFYDDKLITGRYFVTRILPEAASHLVKLKTGAAPVMALADDRF